MRTMLRVWIPADAGNRSMKDGSLQKTMGQALERLRPEAAYFFPDQGERSALMVFNLKDPSEIVAAAEPFFTGLNARLDLTPVMTADDLRAGMEALKGK